MAQTCQTVRQKRHDGARGRFPVRTVSADLESIGIEPRPIAESIRPNKSWAALEHALGEHGQQSLQRRGQKHKDHAHDGQATSAGARPDEFQALADVVVDG
jgi:hypothetical protein